MRVRLERGFSVLELLMVVALILIVAAIAVPGLMRAKMSSTEANAIGSLRALLSSQSTYASSCGGGFYAPTLARLATVPAEGGSGFIEPNLGMDPATKSGYVFTLTAGPVAAASPASCNGAAAGTLASSYFINADPLPATGERHFGANQGGTIYQADVVVPVAQTGAPAGSTPIQ